MIVDQSLVFSDAQNVTASAASTNVLDAGVLGQTPAGQNTNFLGATIPNRNFGAGQEFQIVIQIGTVTATTPTFTAKLQGATAAAFGSPVDLEVLLPAAVTPVANTQIAVRPNAFKPYEFYRLYYTVTGTITTLAISAYIVLDAQTSQFSQSY